MAETSIATLAPTAPDSPYPLPRVTIRFCTQCKWMLRAAYFAQELLSTFSTSLGEVALQPSTGGTFIVSIVYAPPNPTSSIPSSPTSSSPQPAIQQRVLWDRKLDGGFPETKELKRRVRDVIEPGRNLGHVDKDYGTAPAPTTIPSPTIPSSASPSSSVTAQPSQSQAPSFSAAENARSAEEARAKQERRASLAKIEKDNALGLNTHPDENIGGACRPGVESVTTNARIEADCEDCK